MSPSRDQAHQKAIERIRRQQHEHNTDALLTDLLSGDRGALSRAVTIIESTAHHAEAQVIVRSCLPHSGKSIRIGITGVPGVGKSSFIEAFGLHLIQQGKKVAVLAIDPSSPISGGSILGDKTRMEELSMHPHAFIRPSPSSDHLGGVAKKTRESIILCEAAGFDVIIIETVGVGQSETTVHAMCDFFLLLMLAGAGDQLQGIKRGIMEMCDGMLITKSDGENIKHAMRAKGEYSSALHLFPPRESGWYPQVHTCSALEKTGIAEAWEMIVQFERWMNERDIFNQRRKEQDLAWMKSSISTQLVDRFFGDAKNQELLTDLQEQVVSGKMSPFEAAEKLLNAQRPA